MKIAALFILSIVFLSPLHNAVRGLHAKNPPSSTDYGPVSSPPPLVPNKQYWGTFYYPWYGGWQFTRNPTAPVTCNNNPCLNHTEPDIIKINKTLYLYYRTDHSIGVATNSSDDGTSWIDLSTVLTYSSSGWDSGEVIAPSVIVANMTHYIFYEALDPSTGYRAIGIANSTSPTGPFTKCSCNPILTPSRPWEGRIVGTPVVTKIGSMFYMFYHGFDGEHDRTGVAYSHDLVHWTKETNNPILDIGSTGSWDSSKVAASSSYISSSVVWVFYEGYDGASWRIGVASGVVDPINFQIGKLTKNQSPVLDLGPSGYFDNATAQRPNVSVSPDGAQFWMYYSGNDGLAFRLGRATASVNETLRHWKDTGNNNCLPCTYNPPITWSSFYLPDDGTGNYSTASLYSSTNPAVINRQLAWMDRARLDFALVSWWGQGSYEDHEFSMMLQQALNQSSFSTRLALYYELEGSKNPTVNQIVSDLTYIYRTYTSSNEYFRVSNDTISLPAVFVYANSKVDNTTAQNGLPSYVDRWAKARSIMYEQGMPVFISLKVFNGYDTNTTALVSVDSWYQYGPALPYEPPHQNYSAYVSPGYVPDPETNDARSFQRNTTSFARNVAWLANQSVAFHLIETFNEFHEGTQIEPAFKVNHDNRGFTLNSSSYGFAFIDIIRNRTLTLNAQALPSRIDAGQYVAFNCGTTGGFSPYTYMWNFGDGSTESGSNPTHRYAAPGPMKAVCRVADSLSRTANSSVTVLVSTDPVLGVPIALPKAIDTGQVVAFSISASGGSGVYEYMWSGLPSGCTSSNTSGLACTPNAAGTFMVIVRLTDSNGFMTTSSPLAFTVNLDPSITSFTLDSSTISLGQNITLVVSAGQGTGQLTYSYTGLPPGCSSENAPVITCRPAALGHYSIEITLTDSVGKTTISTVELNVSQPGPRGLPIAEEYALAGGVVTAIVGVTLTALALTRRRIPSTRTRVML